MATQHAGLEETRSHTGTGRATARSRFRALAGLTLLVVGIICAIPGVPGPGIATVIVALVILSEHYAWAARLLRWVRAKARQAGLPEWHWLHRETQGTGEPVPSAGRAGADANAPGGN